MALAPKAYAELTVVAAKDLAFVPDKLDLVKAAGIAVGHVDRRAVDHEGAQRSRPGRPCWSLERLETWADRPCGPRKKLARR